MVYDTSIPVINIDLTHFDETREMILGNVSGGPPAYRGAQGSWKDGKLVSS